MIWPGCVVLAAWFTILGSAGQPAASGTQPGLAPYPPAPISTQAKQTAPASSTEATGTAAPAEESLDGWLAAVAVGMGQVREAAVTGRTSEAQALALRLYLEYFERVEGYYGPGGPHATTTLAAAVTETEAHFHRLLQAPEPALIAALAGRIAADASRLAELARSDGVPLVPGPVAAPVGPAPTVDRTHARTPEIRGIVQELRSAAAAYQAGDASSALASVEHAYLEGLEPLESRLPSAATGKIERLIHLGLRPQISRGAPAADVARTFEHLEAELLAADAHLEAGASFWFGAFNSFVIIVREGLEAVLLIGALLAYLTAAGADRRHKRQLFAGVGLGVAASFATWIVAQYLLPVGGAGRELVEGVTALLAVGVLLYVSHWLFQKTYIHDWKAYLRERVGHALSTGSALAMAGLAFAAVYREGFETVLFYQALRFDAGAGAVLAGFVPGMILILAVGVAIIRLGVKLPLRQVFGATNAILLYLAFVFLGKGIYNLQEAGLFAPHPLAWAPDSEALRLVLGFYPIAETAVAQLAFLTMVAATYLGYRWVGARRTRSREAPAASPGAVVEARPA